MDHVIGMKLNEIGLVASLLSAHMMALILAAGIAWKQALIDEQARVRERLARMRQMIEARPTRHIVTIDEDGRPVDLYEFDTDRLCE